MQIPKDITEHKSMYELFIMLQRNKRKEEKEYQYIRIKKDKKK